MKTKTGIALLMAFMIITMVSKAQDKSGVSYQEPHRPQVHYSPEQHWVNDPNGMVYFNHTYHLFFQYYPGDIVWGPMHWGHAESKDLVHWKQLPVALYPDSLGYIFSGSAVVDSNNTSGFGKNGKVPLVAIFTHHDPKGEKAGTDVFQNQSIAYSLDNGLTWTKYADNPVLKNPGIKDFRDPKVMWYAKQKKWVMTLATKDHITFYSAPDLKAWKKESEFGLRAGAHGGVWECPDLFPLKLNGKTYWILVVNINPGGPNGGSATQYFVGDFNGHQFMPMDTQTRWLDYGPDEYAGITWSNTGSRKIFLGWMSNWEYANQVPTEKWRNAMTIPRDLHLKQSKQGIVIASKPVPELANINANTWVSKNVLVNKTLDLNGKVDKLQSQYILKLNTTTLKGYTIKLSNNKKEEVLIGYDDVKGKYFIDRTKSGRIDFKKGFSGRFEAPRLSSSKSADLTIVVDKASVELFADGGLTTMTAIYFPNEDYSGLAINVNGALKLNTLTITGLKSIWK
ncbi:glycoside hydrolase family 32 protein [Mucilaginibacter polytrichastri]|uniref:Levanase n=1 Tax=Mucilaginibacter polytrichastri TaxID=1302689 RepID=A0A1Q5ZTB6_9SPHI|nr:glycoside hydrolase family 32 protein [Mucilaginibacter polytrichastri]OKS84918.1 Levanase [Mucilaginibacter polytrichastri]SFS47644.1 fructan beta-fructosidase [Mucilaginibacter polytrichastri]